MLRLGVILILLSFVPWLALPTVPWIAEGAGARATWVGALIVTGELLFWPGLALAGKEVWSSAKAHGWRKMIPELLRQLGPGQNRRGHFQTPSNDDESS